MPTATLSRFCAELSYEDLPSHVVEKAKACLLDFLRLAVAGAVLPWGEKAHRYARRQGAAGACTLLYYGDRLSPSATSFANGVFGFGLDWDDTHIGSYLHPGVVTFPAALAAAEEAGASGKELLTAAVLGYEVTIRVALGVLPSHYLRGFHATATCGVLGGAAAAARLLGAGAEGIESALGLAASSASGLLEFFKKGSHVKRLHGGFAGEASVRAALLVREGLEGPRGVLEGELGFGRAFSDAPSWDLALSGLGEDFKIGETCFKTHAGGGHFHAAVDAALRLAGRLRPRWEEVEEVDVGTLEAFARAAGQGEPADLQMAQMNLPFNVALALVEGGRRGEFWFPLTLSDFERGLADQEVLSVARRVRCEPDEEVAARADDAHLPARVKIRMRDGRREEEFLEYARGTAGCPLTRDELEGRFLETLGRHLGLSRAEDALSALGQIEGSSSITSILRLFVRSD